MISRDPVAICYSQRFTQYQIRTFLAVFGLFLASSVLADTTTLAIAGASKGTSNVPVTMLFPITRSGDNTYDVQLTYHTVDGTALAGTDYVSTAGTITLPAGASSATIPITLNPNTTSNVDLTFQLQLDSVIGTGPAPSFAAQQKFATGSYAYSLTVADINGDGKPDVIIANYIDGTVSVLLNATAPGATTPSFAAQQTFPVGSGPRSVTAVDLNGDGKPDLIVANSNYMSGDTVSVLLNTTAPGSVTASFTAQSTFMTGTGPQSVTAADVNGDGKSDLIVANETDKTVSVLIITTSPGATTPSFATQHTFVTGTNPTFVTTEDLNGDGKPDLIVTNRGDNTISVLLNTTAPGAVTPSFANQQVFATGAYPASVSAIDVNGDGKPDLIVANDGNSSVSVLINTTQIGFVTSTFALQQTFAAGLAPSSVSAVDVNGDGKPDLIVSSIPLNTISILINTTAPGALTPSFGPQLTFATGQNPYYVATADINGDGKPDLIVANGGDNSVSVLLNTTALGTVLPNFTSQQSFATGMDPYFVTAADLNGDGKPDMVVVNKNDGTVSVFVDTAEPGATTPSFAAPQTFNTGSFPTCVAISDINGDGKPDLIIADYNSQAVLVLLNTTTPGDTTLSFAAVQAFTAGLNPFFVVVADVNGDGRPDVIATNYSSNTVSVMLNTTAPGAATPSFTTQQTFATGNSPSSLAAADINNDGKPDIIATNLNDNSISVLLNTTPPGASTSSFATQQIFATGNGPLSVTAGDINGDGKPDLIETDLNDNTVSVLINTTTSGSTVATFASRQTFAAGGSPASVRAVDINSDGKPDLVVADRANSVSVLFNTSVSGSLTPSFAAYQAFPAGLGPESVAVADLNGDGKADLMVANLDDNTVSVFLNTQYQVTTMGSPGTGTIVHDYIFANGFE